MELWQDERALWALGLSGFCGKKWLRTAAKEVIKHDNESFPQRCRVREQLKLEGAAVWALRVKASLLAVWIERLWLGDARPGPPALESFKKALALRKLSESLLDILNVSLRSVSELGFGASEAQPFVHLPSLAGGVALPRSPRCYAQRRSAI